MEFVPHTAALLAGGKSTRMGRDKASLLVNGVPLWQRQLAVLRATGPAELFISGPVDGAYAAAAERIVVDAMPAQGPLGGLAAVLAASTQPWLLVLAVDLPSVPASFLVDLLAQAERTGRGVVPANAGGHWEPLAAVYPRAAARHAVENLRTGERRLSVWIDRLEAEGLVGRQVIAEDEKPWFVNWNSPGDVGIVLFKEGELRLLRWK